jgi:hypothetical protein
VISGSYLSELFAIFFLFQLLPVPVNFYIFLVRLDDFVLDLVRSFLFVFLLQGTPVFVQFFSFCLDLDDSLLSQSAHLLELT